MVLFSDGTCTHFGDPHMLSYPFHKNKERKRRYMLRHQRDLRTRDPTRAGFLSWYILWQFTSVSKSVREYNRWLSSGVNRIPADLEQYNKSVSHRIYEHTMQQMGLDPWVKLC